MSTHTHQIHPTAIIEAGAHLAANVTIGAYAFIGSQVSIDEGCHIHHHATVEGYTQLGKSNEVFPYACIGMRTQDLKYRGGKTGLKIADNNIFREYTTVHTATEADTYTIVGSHNIILAYSHIAHDCQVGDHVIMSSHAALGGHVRTGNHINIGWGAGIHQFCYVGDYAMVGFNSKVVQDIPPFMIADGSPAAVRMVNRVGLERNQFDESELELARTVYKILYREGLNRSQALKKLENHPRASSRIIQTILQFATTSTRGFA
jgi:UDP-N-acetylglucosamine acyltransferase